MCHAPVGSQKQVTVAEDGSNVNTAQETMHSTSVTYVADAMAGSAYMAQPETCNRRLVCAPSRVMPCLWTPPSALRLLLHTLHSDSAPAQLPVHWQLHSRQPSTDASRLDLKRSDDCIAHHRSIPYRKTVQPKRTRTIHLMHIHPPRSQPHAPVHTISRHTTPEVLLLCLSVPVHSPVNPSHATPPVTATQR